METHRSLTRATLWGAVCLGLVAALPGAAYAADSAGSGDNAVRQPASAREIAALSPDAQNRILDPLRDAAAALDAQGRGAFADVYAGVRLDAVRGTVALFTTKNPKALVTAAKKAAPHADLSVVQTAHAKYTKAELRAARDRVTARGDAFGVQVNTLAVPADGSGLKLGVAAKPGLRADIAAAAPELSAAAGVDVVVAPGEAVAGTSRYADTAPYYSGAYITSSIAGCTTGLPVMDGSGKGYIVTASHCGRTGVRFVTGNGTVMGTATNHSTWWDASLIPAPSARWEYDGPAGGAYEAYKLTSTAYSYEGDYVHQNGYTSGVVGGIVVDDGDVQTTVWTHYYGSWTSRGVRGHQVGGGCSVRPGDSGGLVFRYVNDANRQVRGLVSAGDCGRLFWTEALDIYNTFGVTLTTRVS